MSLISASFEGNAQEVEKILRENPDLVHEEQEWMVLGKSVKVTPLRAAAIAGNGVVVRSLYFGGAPKDEDLLPFACLCPDRSSRNHIIEELFSFLAIPSNIPHEYVPLLKFGGIPIRHSENIHKANRSTCSLKPYGAEILAGLPHSSNKRLGKPENTPQYKDMSPLELEAWRVAVYMAFRDHGMSLPKVNYEPQTFDRLVELGDLEGIKAYIKSSGRSAKELFSERIFRQDSLSTFPIDIAVLRNHVEILRYMHLCGIDFTPEKGVVKHPLHEGVKNGSLAVVKFFIDEAGVDPNQCNPLGQTPASVAANHNKIEILKFLGNKGANLFECSTLDSSPGLAAAKSGSVPILTYLLQLGLDPFLFCMEKQVHTLVSVALNYSMPHFGVLSALGIAPQDQELLGKMKLERSLSELTALHTSCFVGNAKCVQAYHDSEEVTPNMSPAFTYEDRGKKKTWSLIDLTLHHPGATEGPLTEREERQVEILKLLEKMGIDHETLLNEVQKKRPRLYYSLLSETEKLFADILENPYLLKKVIENRAIFPSELGTLIWKQGYRKKKINPQAIGVELQITLGSVLSKKSYSSIFHTDLMKRLERFINTLKLITDENCPKTLSENEGRQLVQLWITLEKINGELGKKMSESLGFKNIEPPTIILEPTKRVRRSSF